MVGDRSVRQQGVAQLVEQAIDRILLARGKVAERSPVDLPHPRGQFARLAPIGD